MRYSIKRSVEVSRNLIFFQQAEQIGFFLSRAAISVANEVKSTSASHQYAVDISRCSFKKTNKKKLIIKMYVYLLLMFHWLTCDHRPPRTSGKCGLAVAEPLKERQKHNKVTTSNTFLSVGLKGVTTEDLTERVASFLLLYVSRYSWSSSTLNFIFSRSP